MGVTRYFMITDDIGGTFPVKDSTGMTAYDIVQLVPYTRQCVEISEVEYNRAIKAEEERRKAAVNRAKKAVNGNKSSKGI